MSYKYDIFNAVNSSLSEITSNRLVDIIEQYSDSIELYSDNLPINWKYELETIDLITKNADIFKHCETITRLINYNTIEEYKIFSQEEIEIAKWISKYFIKSKANIERSFTKILTAELTAEFNSAGFVSNDYFTDIHLDDSDELLIYKDIDIINDARHNRLTFKNEKENKSHRIVILFSQVVEDKQILLNLTNYVGGLSFIVITADMNNQLIDEKISLNLEEFDTFNSSNISKLLDKEYTKKLIQECKTKILAGLKQIEV